MGGGLISDEPAATVLVVMGVSGAGKTTVAEGLAARLGWTYLEGDSLHPAANVEKMGAGRPLTDEDRWPWLERIAEWIEQRLRVGENGIVTCSALKRSYREVLSRAGGRVVFVFLAGERATLEERMRARAGHFMPASLLDSQLETLEEPAADETAVRVAIEQPVADIVDDVVAALSPSRRASPGQG